MVPIPRVRQTLTGMARFRQGWFGRLLGQWEDAAPYYLWRDARPHEVANGVAFFAPTVDFVARLYAGGRHGMCRP